MATIIDEIDEKGFILKQISTWMAYCDGCGEFYDLDENGVDLLIDDGWFVNDDGQFCSHDCYNTHLIISGERAI